MGLENRLDARHPSREAVHAFGEVVHAFGEVVHAFGEVVHAFGEVVHAFGEVVHAAGEIVHTTGKPGDLLTGLRTEIADLPLESQELTADRHESDDSATEQRRQHRNDDPIGPAERFAGTLPSVGDGRRPGAGHR